MKKLISCFMLFGGLLGLLANSNTVSGQMPPSETKVDASAVGTVTIGVPTENAGVITVSGTSLVKPNMVGWTAGDVTVYAVHKITQNSIVKAGQVNGQGAWSITMPRAVKQGDYHVWAVGKFVRAQPADVMDIGTAFQTLTVAANQVEDSSVGAIGMTVVRQQANAILYGSGTWQLFNPPVNPNGPRPAKKYELAPQDFPVYFLCIPVDGGRVNQQPCVVNGLAGDAAGYQMTGAWNALLPGINVGAEGQNVKYNVYSSFLVKNLAPGGQSVVLTVVQKDK